MATIIYCAPTTKSIARYHFSGTIQYVSFPFASTCNPPKQLHPDDLHEKKENKVK